MYDHLNILIQVTQILKGQYSTAEYLLIQMASSLCSWVISLTMLNQCTSQDPFLQTHRNETLVASISVLSSYYYPVTTNKFLKSFFRSIPDKELAFIKNAGIFVSSNCRIHHRTKMTLISTKRLKVSSH